MRAYPVGLVGSALVISAACALQPTDDGGPNAGDTHGGADPRAVAAEDAAVSESSIDTVETGAAADVVISVDAAADSDVDVSVDAPVGSDSSDTADAEPDQAAPLVCPASTCQGWSWLVTWEQEDGGCVAKGYACSWKCAPIDGGMACVDEPAECALGTPWVSGAVCPVLAAGLCFANGADACACACPGTSCTIQPKPKLKLPPKLPPKSPMDASTMETSTAAMMIGDGGDGGDDAAPISDASFDASDASPEASTAQLIAVCGS